LSSGRRPTHQAVEFSVVPRLVREFYSWRCENLKSTLPKIKLKVMQYADIALLAARPPSWEPTHAPQYLVVSCVVSVTAQ
jgi:hypothetical protein